MKDKEFKDRKKEVKALFTKGQTDDGFNAAVKLIEDLFSNKEYHKIVEVFDSNFIQTKRPLYVFEVAYAFVELRQPDRAEPIYELIVSENPKNTAALNNLSNIKKSRGLLDQAFDLIQRAYNLAPDDEIIAGNYKNLLAIVQEKDEIDRRYRSAMSLLSKENDFVITKLKAFVTNSKSDQSFEKGQLPIPRWKLKVLMETDEQKALSLLNQWLDKSYLRKTDKKGTYQEPIYEINPYIEKHLYNIAKTKTPPKWIQGIEELSVDTLEKLSYFPTIARIERVKRKYRTIIQRDLDELFLNYIMKNEKSVIVLSGSLVELLLIYYCEKKSIKQISYQREDKKITRKLYDADLGDLLCFFEQQKKMEDITIHMGNISRIYRNFIHPGKELREAEELNQTKADLCFISTLEIIKTICS
jgi:tetratricopeptide (TPR) repeat protein